MFCIVPISCLIKQLQHSRRFLTGSNLKIAQNFMKTSLNFSFTAAEEESKHYDTDFAHPIKHVCKQNQVIYWS